jgi:hypothetical protein
MNSHSLIILSAKVADPTCRGYIVRCVDEDCDCVYETFGTKYEAKTFVKEVN